MADSAHPKTVRSIGQLTWFLIVLSLLGVAILLAGFYGLYTYLERKQVAVQVSQELTTLENTLRLVLIIEDSLSLSDQSSSPELLETAEVAANQFKSEVKHLIELEPDLSSSFQGFEEHVDDSIVYLRMVTKVDDLGDLTASEASQKWEHATGELAILGQEHISAAMSRYANSDEIYRRSKTNALWVGIVVCSAIVVVLMLGKKIIDRQVTNPLQSLELAAKDAMVHNEHFTIKQAGPREIQDLENHICWFVGSLEKKVNERTAELKERTEDLEKSIEDRKALESQLIHASKMESIGQLAAGIAHEINTPMQYISDSTFMLVRSVEKARKSRREFLESLEQADSSEPTSSLISEYQEDTKTITERLDVITKNMRKGCDRITEIVKSMKNYAHPGSVQIKLEDIPAGIRDTMVISTNSWKYVANIELDFPPDFPLVPCSISEFNQVILNMIVNGAHAIEASLGENPEHKGLIQISGRIEDDQAVITISDNGAGMPEEVQSKVFDPFFTTKAVGVGTGQGLAISYQVIVKQHNGTINLHSKQGEGTVFTIRLPLVPPNQPQASV